jgi:O-antigen ligase
MNKNNIIKWTIFTGLWAVLLIPFFVADTMFFPYITGKNFAFRIIVEIIFALWVYLAFVDAKYRPKFSWVSIAVGAFVFIMLIADIFAVNPLKAIWSNYERMDGFVTLLHLIMYLFVFGNMMKSEKNWLWFFRSSVISSIIMIFPVIQEWIKTKTVRVSVTLGNPIYVAVFFMFNFFFVLILLYKDVIVKNENDKKPLSSFFGNWLSYAYVIAAFICVFGIWRTSTRGVILGLLGGLIVMSVIIAIFEKKNKIIKNSSIGLLVIIAVFIGGFLAIKNTQFVKNNTTLERLAEISWNDVAGQGQARQYVWPMALKGVAEKPILGWGQDGFNNVFNKYYDVRMYNQEQWFDRAHNTPLDVLVAGGILGLITYLSIFVAALYVIIKKKNNFSVTEGALIVGLLAAYFAQNLFVFDNLISYILFYVVLAYLYSRDTSVVSKDTRVISNDIANYVVAPIVVVAIGAMLWYANIKPINANLNLINAMQSANSSATTSLNYFKKVFAANTFGNSEAREQLISLTPSITSASGIDTTVKQEFAQLAFSQMTEQLKQTPYDARYQFFMGTFLDNMGQYQMALPYLQKAVELSPKKLTMMFELAKCYSYLGQGSQAVTVAKTAYDLMPVYTDAKNNYTAALIVSGQDDLAKQMMGNATTTDQSIVRAYLINASILLGKGNKSGAIAEIQKAIDIAPVFKTQGGSLIKGISDGSIK